MARARKKGLANGLRALLEKRLKRLMRLYELLPGTNRLFLISNKDMEDIRTALTKNSHFRGREASKIKRESEINVLAFPEPASFPHPESPIKPQGDIYLNRDMARAHIKNIFSRDADHFRLAQGKTTKAYSRRVRQGGMTMRSGEGGRIPKVFGSFRTPLRYDSVAVHPAQLPRHILRNRGKISKRDLKHAFDVGPKGEAELLTYWLIHGFLHLQGFRHSSVRDRMKMEREENRLRGKIK